MIRTTVLAAVLAVSLAASPASAGIGDDVGANTQSPQLQGYGVGEGEGGCLELRSEIGWVVAIDGILDRRTIHVPIGQPDGEVRTERRQTYFVVPENPDSCFIDEDGQETPFSDVHIYSTDQGTMKQLADRIGSEVHVTGHAFAGHSMFHYAPLVMEVLEIESLEAAPQPQDY